MKYIFLIVFLPIFANAKCYVLGNGQARKIECVKGFLPSNVVVEAPKVNNQYVRDIEVVSVRTVQDADGNDVPEAFVDSVKVTAKAALDQARLTTETDRETRKGARLTQLRNAFRNFDTLSDTQKDNLLKALLKGYLIILKQESE